MRSVLVLLAAVLGFTDQVVIKSATVRAPTCAATHVAMAQAEAAAKGLTYGGCGDGLPLVQFADISIVGGFRLPQTTSGVSNFGHSGGGGIGLGGGIAFDDVDGKLYVTCEQLVVNGGVTGAVAEVNIPALVYSTTLGDLNTATVNQHCADVFEGNESEAGDLSYMKIGSLLVYDGRLIGTIFHQYDGSNETVVSHWAHSKTLSSSSFEGFDAVYQANMSGYTSWWMTLVPSVWQSALGGPALTGNCCLSVITRTSWGPDAFAFNPADITGRTTQTHTGYPLTYYTSAHPTLGEYSTGDPDTDQFNQTAQIGGMVIVPGTRTLLYFGRMGLELCYGAGLSDPDDPLIGTPYPPPNGPFQHCYDPLDSNEGAHGYPYVYRVWAYDLNDLAAVKAGTKNYWEPEPYFMEDIDFPIDTPSAIMGGVTINPATNMIYVSIYGADPVPFMGPPVIYGLQVTVP